MASDGVVGGRAPGWRLMNPGFQWISSSPSPAVVERLEALFPDTVCLPVSELESESAGWLQRAVLARSYLKWVPAEAIIREFRRAGVSGAIVPISLAGRCHIFRFEDPAASAFVLERPWVVNGQIIGTEAWRPEFFPVDGSIPKALLWVRLPCLPMEFWKEDFLRMIVEPVGQLVSVDSSTLAKNRGGYARVAVRVDLSRPLRPGTRIQGILGIFWQQFVFESLEGICPLCGSIHLVGKCTQAAMAEGDRSEDGAVFGPWMAAIRQRKSSVSSQKSGGNVLQPKPPPVSSVAPDSSPGSPSQGWKFPEKLARRRTPGSAKADCLPARSSSQAERRKTKSAVVNGVTPTSVERAVFTATVKEKQKMSDSVALASNPLEISNPFASLDGVSELGEHRVCRDVSLGPLKRARPEVSLAPRSFSSSAKRKGKGKTVGNPSKLGFISPPAREVVMVNSAQVDASVIRDVGGDSQGHGSAFPSRVVECGAAVEGCEASSSRIIVGGPLFVGGLSDSVMSEDQGGSGIPPSL